MSLPEGLSGERVQGLARLVSDICGRLVAGRPYLAPALLFADHGDHPGLAMPELAHDELLIHDYQALEQSSALPLDEPLRAELQRKDGPASSEYRIDFGGTALTVALRKVKRADVATLTPTASLSSSSRASAPPRIVTSSRARSNGSALTHGSRAYSCPAKPTWSASTATATSTCSSSTAERAS